MKVNIDPHWQTILKNAYSSRMMLGSAASSVIVAIQTGNNYAIVAAVLSLLGLVCRVVVQPVLRAEMQQADECIDKL